MFENWKQRRREKQEAKEKTYLERCKVSFCLQDVEFMDYDLPVNLSVCGNELSLYERYEKSFDEEVCRIFREITEELTEDYRVLQWLRWSGAEPMPAIRKYKAGEGAVSDKHFIVKCTENGADPVLMEMQMGKGNEWQFTEQECYCYQNILPTFSVVEEAAEYIEEQSCDLYIMLDLEHSAMMVKTKKEEELKKVEECMRRVCAEYKKEIHDYIGYDWTQKST